MKTTRYLLSIAGMAIILFASCKKDATQTQRIDASQTDEIKFVYNGDTVKYGKIVSPVTGRIWMDRNLGASRRARSSTDYHAYGDLFQWGRPADGHQLINWTSKTTGTAVNGTTTTLATSNIPGNNLFIMPSAFPYDWRDNNNHNRWNTNPRGPCPYGWHVPTYAEWNAETAGYGAGGYNATIAFDNLKLTMPGWRYSGNGNIYNTTSQGTYWGSDIQGDFGGSLPYLDIFPGSGQVDVATNSWADGYNVRCIKNL